ncbi:hypothetical protein RYX36_017517 [Vicia faba]
MSRKGKNTIEQEEDQEQQVLRRVKPERVNANDNDNDHPTEEQNSSIRRIIRSEFLKLKSLINEKKDDLLNVDSDKFDSILSKFDKLHDQVKKPREQVADAEALLDLTRTLVGSVKSLVNEGVTPSQFVSSLIQRYAPSPNSSIDWPKLGTSVSSIFLTVHGSSTMLGPMESQLKQRKTIVSRKRTPRSATTDRPEQLNDAVEGEKTDTDKNMSTMFNLLRENKKVQLEYLILNRFSFAQTVENLFALSFLVKDGRAEINMDKNHSHYVSPKNAPAANAVMSKEVSYTHFVFRYDYNDWKIMKDLVPDGKELMPHRVQHSTVDSSQAEMNGDNSAQALPVTPIRKISRNRGRVLQEESVVEESPECDDEDASREAAIRRCKRKLH